ncbi:transmembrane protein EpsG [Clostridium polyendosporum]|uniref:Transmembrane protein EpsG n=1 Tax=Clostridium polyendosporum TaxID=69208 RepID=A0A919S079_9CLOT|nr:EpsG family protein [Clostridium polyendosporum]GIM28750.1 transmembrane protein EpsG [Clostridium polyendosporum]
MKYVYFTTMFIVFILALMVNNNKYRSLTLSRFSTFIILTIIILISGFRSPNSIGDTGTYTYTYRLINVNPHLLDNSKDYGFTLIMILLNKISRNPQILIFFTAFITNLFIILALYKYAKPFALGIYLYFGTVLYYVTMNGIRQSMAAAILFWAVRYVINNQWKTYFIIVILVSTLHGSAVIFLPLYFLVRKEVWNRTFWAVFFISVMLVVAFRPMLGIIVKFLETTQYSNYGRDMANNSSSVNLIRLSVTFVPIVLAYLVKDKVRNQWPESSVFIYMSLFNCIFMLFSTQYLYFYRLCIYFELYNLILISRLVHFYDKKTKMLLYTGIITFYFIFSWYQVSLWNDYYRNVLVS